MFLVFGLSCWRGKWLSSATSVGDNMSITFQEVFHQQPCWIFEVIVVNIGWKAGGCPCLLEDATFSESRHSGHDCSIRQMNVASLDTFRFHFTQRTWITSGFLVLLVFENLPLMHHVPLVSDFLAVLFTLSEVAVQSMIIIIIWILELFMVDAVHELGEASENSSVSP
jgi:hypothetical protein